MPLFIEIPFCPSLCALFWKKKYCIESLTKRKTFLIIHPPLMEIPAKNTIGLSIERVTFTSGSNKKTVISPPIFTLLHFCFLSHKDHIKTPFYEPKIKILTKFFIRRYPLTLSKYVALFKQLSTKLISLFDLNFTDLMKYILASSQIFSWGISSSLMLIHH